MRRGVLGWLGLGAVASRTSDLLNPAAFVVDAFAGRQTLAGTRTSPDRALTLSTYFACTRNTAEDLAALPPQLLRRRGRTIEQVQAHPVAPLLERPNPEMSWQAFVEVLQGWALGWGNGRAQIQRAGDGLTPLALWPIHPSRVSPRRATGRGAPHEPAGLEFDELWYHVRGENGLPDVGLHARDVFDLHGWGPDGISGYSIAQQAAEDLGLAHAGREFEARIYSSGASSRGVLETDKMLDAGVLKRLRRQWAETYGGADQTGKPIILERGMSFKSVSINPRDAQFIESQIESEYTVCRWFRMPPHKVGLLQRATWNNIEAQEIEYVVDVIAVWASRWEREARYKLLSPAEFNAGELYLQLKLQGRLRGDYTSRTQGYERLVRSGILTPNECRALEDQNPSPQRGADSLWLQAQMQPLELLATPRPAPPPPRPGAPGDAPPAPPQEPGPDGSPHDQGADPAPAPGGDRAALAAALVAEAHPDVGIRAIAARRAELRADVATLRPVLVGAAERIVARHRKMLERFAETPVGPLDRKLATLIDAEPAHVAEIVAPLFQAAAAAAGRRGWTVPVAWAGDRAAAFGASYATALRQRIEARGAASGPVDVANVTAYMLGSLEAGIAEIDR